jgi:predicted transcriptional regulator
VNASIAASQQLPASEPEVLAGLVESIVLDSRVSDPEMGIKNWQVERILRDRYGITTPTGQVAAIMELLGEQGRLEVTRDNVCYGGLLIRVDVVARPVVGC